MIRKINHLFVIDLTDKIVLQLENQTDIKMCRITKCQHNTHTLNGTRIIKKRPNELFVHSLEQTRFDIEKSKKWARGNRKTLKCPKMNSKSKLRNLILKISDL